MNFEVRKVGEQPLSTGGRLVLASQQLVGTDFSDQQLVQFSSDGCRFEACNFEGSVIESASFGGGRRTSEYVGCSFDGATLRMGPGGYARFVDCTFERTIIENWFCFAVEVIGCRFSGRLKKVVFNGTVPDEKQAIAGRRENRFEDNDFSRATLVDVGFRTGVDLSQQRLPRGDEYTYLPDAVAAVRRARTEFDSWDDPKVKSAARGVLRVMEDDVTDGQRQLLLRIDDFPRSDRAAIEKLLSAAVG